jgi:sugar phosphate isomerase/epimerase
MKKLFLLLLISVFFKTFSQEKAPDQNHKLSQYIGNWLSADNINEDKIGKNPFVKMTVKPRLDGKSLQIEVFLKEKERWNPLMVELISYDAVTDQIVAAGQNNQGQAFIGKGYFTSKNNWFMNDVNYKGEPTQKVDFKFINSTEVVLKGTIPNANGWETKYIKDNPKDKNIGIQLVSVKDMMKADPSGTLKQLGRMGFSYVETFVYLDRKFYGMSPVEFRKLVEANGLKFTGSMTFKNLPESSNYQQTMDWWKVCIQDHLDAGVEYLTTSNTELQKITSLKQLKKYCDYYNAVGKLCKEKGLIFGFHNHADEFKKIEGITIYDYLLQNTNPKYVSFQSDVEWMRVGGVNPIDYYKKYPSRFFSWHVKEDGELGSTGKVNYEELYSFAKQAGLKYNVAEVEKYNFTPIQSVEMAFQFLYYADFVSRFEK